MKASLRGIAPWRVDEVAKSFGGGGHAQAAGCTLKDVTAAEALDMVLARLTEEHKRQEQQL